MIRVGVFFGGSSREREVSFAGGRTVYDNLDKSMFEAVPIFVDPWGNFCLLDWKYIYKGSIRDFYPPVKFLPHGNDDFQFYAENIGDIRTDDQLKMLREIGKPISMEDLKKEIDFAFLALHGTLAEDGTIQGLLEWTGIPYSGCGILPSSIGIGKPFQKEIQKIAGMDVPEFLCIKRNDWLNDDGNFSEKIYNEIAKKIKFPFVTKPGNQGSSIGITVVSEKDFDVFYKAIDKAFFIKRIYKTEWNNFSAEGKNDYIKNLCDIRNNLGLPAIIEGKIIYNPKDLYKQINSQLLLKEEIIIQSTLHETEVLIEKFISGKEFSCIVIEDENGKIIALPPTEIAKDTKVYDYRSKYLPGLSRKITPIQIEEKLIDKIREDCCELYNLFRCEVYARIDGFITADGKIFLNDPNTTSGMMPSSFFFHQAAEIGLNPSQFLTFIIHTSLRKRTAMTRNRTATKLLSILEKNILQKSKTENKKIRVAVIMGGYSSERHISVESGRNIYEKLSSSEKYFPVPVFLTGNAKKYELYTIPVNVMLKDNADDIKEKVMKHRINPALEKIKDECREITSLYNAHGFNAVPKQIEIANLKEICDMVFIALHGRPGEDGTIQRELEQLQIPYNGSGPESSAVTINKFNTNNILRENGFTVAENMLLKKHEWNDEHDVTLKLLKTRIGFPMICKPADDGCSSAVKRIENEEDFSLYVSAIFRKGQALSDELAEKLKLKKGEEFPVKTEILCENLIEKNNAKTFLEITGGFLTHYDENGKIKYEMFEPSEALSDGAVLSMEEKFLAGEGQNITPPRYSKNKNEQKIISKTVKEELRRTAKLLGVEGYARIDAFVKIYSDKTVEVDIIEINSLPGMTPATAIFHQCTLAGYKPYDFIDCILEFGKKRMEK